MTDFWELEDGSGAWQLEDGSGNWLLEESGVVEAEGGESGGRSKQVGVSAVKKQLEERLGERPRRRLRFETISQIQLNPISKSTGKILIELKAQVEASVSPYKIVSESYGQVLLNRKGHCESFLNFKSKTKACGITSIHGISESISSLFDIVHVYEEKKEIQEMKTELKKFIKILKIMAISDVAKSLERIDIPEVRSFDFVESPKEWEDAIKSEQRFRAFTHSSSFVGNVRYDQQEQSMRILLNGQAYNFCSVPQRIFDAFEGADSKGAFFARNIKGQFNC